MDYKSRQFVLLKHSKQFPSAASFLELRTLPNADMKEVAKTITVGELEKILQISEKNDPVIIRLIQEIGKERDLIKDLPKFYNLLDRMGQKYYAETLINQDKFIDNFRTLGDFWTEPLLKYIKPEQFKKVIDRDKNSPKTLEFVRSLADKAADFMNHVEENMKKQQESRDISLRKAQDFIDMLQHLEPSKNISITSSRRKPLRDAFAQTYLAKTYDSKIEIDPIKIYLSGVYGREYTRMIDELRR